MAKILLTWEAGANLGHETLVTAASVLLQQGGHEVLVMAPHGSAGNEAATCAGIRWAMVPVMPTVGAASSGMAWESRATSLWHLGFHSTEFVADRFHMWDVILQREQPDAVVLQAAPFAQLAAHVAGVPSIEFGVGFDIPPRLSPFPAFKNAASFDPVAALHVEQTLLSRIQQVVGRFAVHKGLHELVSGEQRLVVSLPELDPYASVPDPSRRFIGPLPVLTQGLHRPVWSRGGPKLLAYVRTPLLDAPALLRALGALKGDAVVVCPGADDALLDLARSLSVRLFREPVSFDGLLPAADVVVSHGGGSLMAEALVHGRPCLAMPTHYEQLLTARALKQHGLGVVLNPQEAGLYERALRHVLADHATRRACAAVAREHRDLARNTSRTFLASVNALLGVTS